MDVFGNKGNEDFFRKMNRLLFINDLETHTMDVVPLTPEDFKHLFGEPTNEDLDIMTQILLKDIHRLHNTNDTIIDKWGPDWIHELLEHNISKEEYELCAIMRDVIEESQNTLVKKYLEL